MLAFEIFEIQVIIYFMLVDDCAAESWGHKRIFLHTMKALIKSIITSSSSTSAVVFPKVSNVRG